MYSSAELGPLQPPAQTMPVNPLTANQYTAAGRLRLDGRTAVSCSPPPGREIRVLPVPMIKCRLRVANASPLYQDSKAFLTAPLTSPPVCPSPCFTALPGFKDVSHTAANPPLAAGRGSAYMLFQLYQDFDGRARCTFPLTPFPPGQGAEGGDGIASQPINTLRLGNMMAVQISTPA